MKSGVFFFPSSTEADTGNALVLLEREKNGGGIGSKSRNLIRGGLTFQTTLEIERELKKGFML